MSADWWGKVSGINPNTCRASPEHVPEIPEEEMTGFTRNNTHTPVGLWNSG
jgi:hypothetical protein